MLCCEIPVWLSYVLELPGCRVNYLHVGGDIFVAIDFAKLIEGLVRNVGKVKLMVTYYTVRFCWLHLQRADASTNS